MNGLLNKKDTMPLSTQLISDFETENITSCLQNNTYIYTHLIIQLKTGLYIQRVTSDVYSIG